MKKIVINCCKHCPLRNHYISTDICMHTTIEGAEIEDSNIIPEWCPLENN